MRADDEPGIAQETPGETRLKRSLYDTATRKIRPHKYVHGHEMAERSKPMATSSQRKQTQRSGLQASRPPRGEAPDHTPPAKRSKSGWRRTRRILLVFALL